ncbi:hypothetical protein RFI_30617, partial [Reticulomyxa filosa]
VCKKETFFNTPNQQQQKKMDKKKKVLAFLTEDLGADATIFGQLNGVVSLLLLIGGPIMGKYTDTYGARQSLLICHIGSALSYLSLAIANNLTWLFLSRIFTIFQQVFVCVCVCVIVAMQTSQACITHLCATQEREQAMGRLFLSYGSGMVAGSALGGLLAKHYSVRGDALISCLISIFCVLMNASCLPNIQSSSSDCSAHSNGSSNSNSGRASSPGTESNTFGSKTFKMDNKKDGVRPLQRSYVSQFFGEHVRDIVSLANRSPLRQIMMFALLSTFGTSLWRSMFPLVLKDAMQLPLGK